MIHITRSGPVFSGSAEDLECLRTDFDGCHWVRWPQLLEPELLHIVRRGLEQAEWHSRAHEGLGTELCMPDNPTSHLLHFLFNNASLFRLVQQLTRCGPIGCFRGRVYRVVPGHGHRDDWHSDMVEHRLIAVSLNLSTEVYRGGVLQIRDRESRQILQQVPNVGFGDAVVFRLAHHLEHRITEVEGAVAKTAFAGWFLSEPSFLSVLQESEW